MRISLLPVAAILFIAMASASQAHAQAFNGNGATAFDPQISTVESGAKLDVQATVTADRKYVTMTLQPQVATLIALRDFVFQGPGGTVGLGSNAGGNANGNNKGNAVGASPRGPGGAGHTGPVLPALAKPVGPVPILMLEGMRRVDAPAK